MNDTVNGRLSGLDHLRAFAITYVFFYHYQSLFPHPDWLERLADFGWTGVDLFFVLSGYLMGGQLLRQVATTQHVGITDFYIKRFFRIVPVYLVVVAAYFLFPAVREFSTIPPLWKFLTFTQNLALDVPNGHAFSHAWSLCVEEHFYLVLPILVTWLGTSHTSKPVRAGWIAVLMLIGGMAIRALAWLEWVDQSHIATWWEWVYFPTYARLDGLMIGVSAAALQIFRPGQWNGLTRRWPLLLGASLVPLSISWVLSSDRASLSFSVFGFPLVAMGFGLLLVVFLAPGCLLSRMPLAVTSRVAGWSYSIYLTHKMVIHLSQLAIQRVGLNASSNWALALSAIAALIVAATMYRVVERPFLALREALLKKRLLESSHVSVRLEC
jgi:peptidoglycan/LPS O-acetylase OafA/YrhL